MTKKAVDLSAFDAVAEASGPASKCSVALVLKDLPPERADALRSALEQSKYTHAVIARTVTGWGHRMAGFTVSRHRRGECHCG